MPRTLITAAFLSAAAVAQAQPQYQFTLVEAFTPTYNLRECYLWDINDQGLACGTATRAYQVPNGTSITYSGLTWTAATEKTPLDAITWPKSVNNDGWVVGARTVFDLPSNSVVATIPYPPGGMSTMEALGVNDAGTVVGYAQTCVCSNSQGVQQIPFVWDATNGTRGVDVPGAKELLRVNAGGVAVGNIRGGMRSAFSYDVVTGAYTVLSTLLPPGPFGTVSTVGADVNDAGTIAGSYTVPETGFRRGFTWSAVGGFTFFSSFGGLTNADVYPKGINNEGQVVGYAQFDPNLSVTFHAFVWDAQNGIRNLNALAQGVPAGFIMDRALKINEQGWIVGDGHYGPNWGSSRAFVLRPLTPPGGCYANCDQSASQPVLNVADFTCFLQRYAAGENYANCDQSTSAPVLNVADFTCFLQQYAAGCR
jgi:probable HAF family extracellular repeat protein